MSSTLSKSSLPSPVGIAVPSPYHLWLIRSAPKSRLTRFGARQRPLPGRVVDLCRFLGRATRPNSAMICATVFTLTAQAASRRSAVGREPRLADAQRAATDRMWDPMLCPLRSDEGGHGYRPIAPSTQRALERLSTFPRRREVPPAASAARSSLVVAGPARPARPRSTGCRHHRVSCEPWPPSYPT